MMHARQLHFNDRASAVHYQAFNMTFKQVKDDPADPGAAIHLFLEGCFKPVLGKDASRNLSKREQVNKGWTCA